VNEPQRIDDAMLADLVHAWADAVIICEQELRRQLREGGNR
jgi:hypothetical protein